MSGNRIQMKIRSFDEVSVCMHDLRKCSEKIQNQRPSQSQILSFQGSRQMEPRMLEPSVSLGFHRQLDSAEFCWRNPAGGFLGHLISPNLILHSVSIFRSACIRLQMYMCLFARSNAYKVGAWVQMI